MLLFFCNLTGIKLGEIPWNSYTRDSHFLKMFILLYGTIFRRFLDNSCGELSQLRRTLIPKDYNVKVHAISGRHAQQSDGGMLGANRSQNGAIVKFASLP